MDPISNPDWRLQLSPNARQILINNLMHAIMSNFSVPLSEIQNIAVQFEHEIYFESTSQNDYLKRIAEKILSMGANPNFQNPSRINPVLRNNMVGPSRMYEEEPLMTQEALLQNQFLPQQSLLQRTDGPQVQRNQFNLLQQQQQMQQNQIPYNQIHENQIPYKIHQNQTLHNQIQENHSINGQNVINSSQQQQVIASSDQKGEMNELLVEEIFQEVQSLKDKYGMDLIEIYQHLSTTLNQIDTSQTMDLKIRVEIEEMKSSKNKVEGLLNLLRLDKQALVPQHISLREKLPFFERKIISIIQTLNPKSQPPAQQQQQPPHQHQQQSEADSIPNLQDSSVVAQTGQTGQVGTPVRVPTQEKLGTVGSPVPVPTQGQLDSIGTPILTQELTVGTPVPNQEQTVGKPVPSQEQTVGTPVPNHDNNILVHATEKSEISPIERLAKALRDGSSAELYSLLKLAINDMFLVVNSSDRMAGSGPGSGSRAAIGSDLVPIGNSDGKIKRDFGAGLVNCSELHVEMQKTNKVNYVLMEEINEINARLIDTELIISKEELNDGSFEGIIIKCVHTAIAISPALKSLISPISPLTLLVPSDYPNSAILPKFPEEQRDFDDLSSKARSRFSRSLREFSHPLSLKEMAYLWDSSTREVILEFAKKIGGGTFSSMHSIWQNCVDS